MTSTSRAKGPRRSRSAAPSREASPAGSRTPGSFAHRLAGWTLGLLLVVVPFVLDSSLKDAFRLPKALAGETLALLSLFFLSFAWKGPKEWLELARAPFVRMFGPFVVLATLLSLASSHVAHVHRGLAGLWIGALAVWGWSVGFSRRELRAALSFSLLPAAVLAAVAILQFHGLYEPYAFIGIAETSRFAIGSLAGNVGDLAAALVLPVLLAQADLARRKRVALSGLVLILCAYGLVVTRTFSAVAGVAAGTIVFWALRIPRRRRGLAVVGVAGALVLLFALAGPLRHRSLVKIDEIARGDWNAVLTGRLDGWRAAVWMLEQYPMTGVGVGAFRTEFIPAKTALLEHGVKFFVEQMNVVFANAHNDLLELAAETGWPGLAAFLFGLVLLLRRLVRWWRDRPPGAADRAGTGPADPAAAHRAATTTAADAARVDGPALAWAGFAGLGVLSLANFPFHIAISLWPACLFVAWVLSAEEAS